MGKSITKKQLEQFDYLLGSDVVDDAWKRYKKRRSKKRKNRIKHRSKKYLKKRSNRLSKKNKRGGTNLNAETQKKLLSRLIPGARRLFPICKQFKPDNIFSTYIIKGHGVSEGMPFKIYDGVRVIFLVNYGDTCPISDKLDIMLNDIYEIEGKTIFKDRDTQPILSEEGEDLSNMSLYKYRSKTPIFIKPKIKIGTHVGTLINDVLINFKFTPCDSSQEENERTDCGIDCYQYNEKTKQNKRLGKKTIPVKLYTKDEKLDYIKLSEIIERQGKGTYILRTCRAETGNNLKLVELRRKTTTV